MTQIYQPRSSMLDTVVQLMMVIMMGKMMMDMTKEQRETIGTKLKPVIGKLTGWLDRKFPVAPRTPPTSATPEVNAFIRSEINDLAAMRGVKPPSVQRESIYHLVAWGSPDEIGFSNSWDRVWQEKPSESRRYMKYAVAYAFYLWYISRPSSDIPAITGGIDKDAWVIAKAESRSGISVADFQAWARQNELQYETVTKTGELRWQK